MSGRRSAVFFAAATIAVVACSSGTVRNQPDGGHPTSPFEPANGDLTALVSAAGPTDPNYPAAHAPLPVVDYNGGPVLVTPRVVTVVFGGDPLADRIGEFGRTVGATRWWDAVREGYCDSTGGCIGPATLQANVVLPPIADAIRVGGLADSTGVDTTQMKEFIRENIASGALPAPEPGTVYLLFFPHGVRLLLDDAQSCISGGFAGYHNSLRVPVAGTAAGADAGARVTATYAIVPRCVETEAEVTRTASHELIESSTNPFIAEDKEGYNLLDPVWSAFYGGEVGDLCIDFTGREEDTVNEAGFTLQRSWSNVAAKAQKNPCVPVPPGEVYFNTAPAISKITLNQGESIDLELHGFSDGPAEDWDLAVLDVAHDLFNNAAFLSMRLDRGVMHNGTVATLHISALQSPATQFGSPFVIVSRIGAKEHIWPGTVVGHY